MKDGGMSGKSQGDVGKRSAGNGSAGVSPARCARPAVPKRKPPGRRPSDNVRRNHAVTVAFLSSFPQPTATPRSAASVDLIAT